MKRRSFNRVFAVDTQMKAAVCIPVEVKNKVHEGKFGPSGNEYLGPQSDHYS